MKVTLNRMHGNKMLWLVVSRRNRWVAMLFVGRRGSVMTVLEKRGRGTTAKLHRHRRR